MNKYLKSISNYCCFYFLIFEQGIYIFFQVFEIKYLKIAIIKFSITTNIKNTINEKTLIIKLQISIINNEKKDNHKKLLLKNFY